MTYDWKKHHSLLLLVAVVVIFFISKWVFAGAWFLGDIITFTSPMEQILASAQLTGSLPLWSPDLGNGYPVFANGQIHYFYLPHVLMRLFLTGPQLINGSLLLHGVLAVVGMFLLLRSYSFSRSTVIVASLLFLFGGAYSARFGLFNFVTVVAWLPVLLWLMRVWVLNMGRWALVGLAVGLSLFFYSGNPQAMVLVSIALGLQAAVLFVFHRDAWRRLLLLLLPVLIGVLIASPFILSVLDFLPATDRATTLSPDFLLDTSFSWESLRGIAVMHPFGHAQTYSGPKGESEAAAFIGIGGLIALGIGLWRYRVQKEIAVMGVGLVAIGFGLALGEYSEVASYILLHTPLAKLATPARYFILAHAGLVLISVIGLEYMFSRFKSKIVTLVIALIVLVPPVFFAWTFEDGVDWNSLNTPVLVETLAKDDAGRVFAAPYLADNAPNGNLGVTIWDPVQEELRQSFVSPYDVISGIDLRMSRPQDDSGFIDVRLEDESGATLVLTRLKTEDILDEDFTTVLFDEPVDVGQRALYLYLSSELGRAQAPRVYIHTDGEYDPSGLLEKCVDNACLPIKTESGSVDISFVTVPDHEQSYVMAHEMLGPNVAAGYGLASAQWTGSLPIREHARYIATMEREFANGEYQSFQALLNRLGVTRVVARLAPWRTLFQFPDMIELTRVQQGEDFLVAFKNPLAYPRVHMAETVVAEDDSLVQLEMLSRLDADSVIANVAASANYDGSAKILKIDFTDGAVVIQTQSASTAFLVLRDTYMHGWNTYVDDTQIPTYRVDSVFRGVEVPAGDHAVRFVYEPEWTSWAFGGVLLGGLMLVMMIVWVRRN